MIKKIIEINIDILCENVTNQINNKELFYAESYEGFNNLIDINGDDYKNFVNKIKKTLSDLDFILDEEHRSPINNSNSMYYKFLKFTDDAEVEILIYIRISDHDAGVKRIGGKDVKAKSRFATYASTTLKQQAEQDFGITNNMQVFPIEIIINGAYYPSYNNAYKGFDRFVRSKLLK